MPTIEEKSMRPFRLTLCVALVAAGTLLCKPLRPSRRRRSTS
jgi:hypothetical protein